MLKASQSTSKCGLFNRCRSVFSVFLLSQTRLSTTNTFKMHCQHGAFVWLCVLSHVLYQSSRLSVWQIVPRCGKVGVASACDARQACSCCCRSFFCDLSTLLHRACEQWCFEAAFEAEARTGSGRLSQVYTMPSALALPKRTGICHPSPCMPK